MKHMHAMSSKSQIITKAIGHCLLLVKYKGYLRDISVVSRVYSYSMAESHLLKCLRDDTQAQTMAGCHLLTKRDS